MANYKHDCSRCVYLGEYRYTGCNERYGVDVLDLYFCPGEPTVIARYGVDGEYSSGLIFALHSLERGEYDAPLYEAFCRAQMMGLDVLNNSEVESYAKNKYDEDQSNRRWQNYLKRRR
jgi:hypothetical protein